MARVRRKPKEEGASEPPGPGGSAPEAPSTPAGSGTTGSAPTTQAPAAGPAPGSGLAPRTKESFDELADKAAAAHPQPLRGSVVQPPPAWEPDEVTLGFAMVTDPSGETRELPEPTVLATILIAVEADRRAILNRVAGNFEETVDAVASLFWPFLVVHSGPDQAAAIFDGTGVWKKTFRYTLLPPLDGVQPLLDRELSPVQYLAQMRALAPNFARDPGSEVLTVEGFLPIDPPLLFDVLAQSRFRSDPQAPHAGFLPARHKVEWYHDLVSQMRSWLDRFESDIARLREIRTQVEAITQEAKGQLDAEFRKRDTELQARVQGALAQAQAEVEQAQKAHHAEIAKHLDGIRQSQAVIVRSETAVATSDALAFRATHRRTDPAPHVARGKQAQADIRTATRQIAASRRAIENLHEEQRQKHERSIARVAEIERDGAKALAEVELFRDEYLGAAGELLQTVDGQIAARSTQRNLLAGYFLPLPSIATVSVIWLPLWMATLRSPRGVRQIVFPPMQVRSGIGLSGALKRLFGGIVLPLEPRAAQFDKVFRPTMEEALARDPWLRSATGELTRAADVLVDPDVLARLDEGLSELKREGWINDKQEQEFRRIYRDRAQRHATAPAAPAPRPPEGSPPTGLGPG